MHVKYIQDNLHRMTWYTDMFGIMSMGLLYGLTLWSNVCVGFGSNGFVTKTQPFPMNGHYRTDVISGVGHPRLDSIMPLVSCTVCYIYITSMIDYHLLMLHVFYK
jgi:hypothetical protein